MTALAPLRDALGSGCLAPKQTFRDLRWALYLRMLSERWRIRAALGLSRDWYVDRDENIATLDDYDERLNDRLDATPFSFGHRRAELQAAQMAIDVVRENVEQRWV